ncbi:NAD-dependent epimerase/dehydratase family protein [Roseococcus sp. YIM B11640]|uniref:NAD-dependent epimerase/dehydratase family protein n=1 Tax=Roseococcus sp. YIM B11640 TaxID=3133973 RepID=UPI003C7EB82D
MRTILVTGAAGLVGQNLVARLKADPALRIVAIDKHPANTETLRRLHPEVQVVQADLAEPGPWTDLLDGVDTVVINQAQIGGLDGAEFERNNVEATRLIVEAARRHGVGYLVQISSSVVRSQASDFYVDTKRRQEEFMDGVEIPHVSLRPTLMFGWFDRKHLGWLRRFMDRTPVFPIPGDGKFLRQPLYVGDFVSIIASCIANRTTGTYDISGRNVVEYGELIRMIHRIVKPRARIVNIPYGLFWILLWTYARLNRNPPFTTSQLEALVIPETFPITDWPAEFGVSETPLDTALRETFQHPVYSGVILEF